MGDVTLDLVLLKRVLEVAVLVVIAVIDNRTRRIPNVIVLPATALSLAAAWLVGVPGLGAALGGAAFAAALFIALVVLGALLRMPRAMGMGDVKLAVYIGVVLGWPLVVSGLFAGVVLGGLVALFLLVSRRARPGSHFAYGPWLCIGAIAVLLLPA